ncbi:sigma-54 dependent transcriptional regulator [bacterium]|nr:sigma-54 dependent transcriptional regulator [bacterium]
MTKALVCWIGRTDLNAVKHADERGIGPIARAVDELPLDRIRLLSDYPQFENRAYVGWLKGRTKAKVELVLAKKLLGRSPKSPTHFGDIYQVAVAAIEDLIKAEKSPVDLSLHLSPGTSVMSAIWVILGKTRFPATLIQTSIEAGVEVASVPFDLSADFIPDLLRSADERLTDLSRGLPPANPEFEGIIGESRIMKELKLLARRVAPRSVPVLIEGESGTGKELVAKAIHCASTRREGPFVPVNCGALPSELIESQLFGHKKGAFTGATSDHPGFFEQADRGTLFLDEVGELPLAAQVRFLRVLNDQRVGRLGDTRQRKVDVRVLAATNRCLRNLMQEGSFREDLYYRLAVAMLRLPPLRERQGDIGRLIDHKLQQVNRESTSEPGYEEKGLSAGARDLLTRHPWPGNVRELENTLVRLAIWTPGSTIGVRDVRDALASPAVTNEEAILARPLGSGLDVRDLVSQVARHYLKRSLEETNGNKSKAAELIGLPSYQTFTNWLTKYDVDS